MSWLTKNGSLLATYFLGLVLSAASASAPATHEDCSGQADDLRIFRRDFFDVDQSYSKRARQEADVILRRLERHAGNIPPIDFSLTLCRIAALADNAHSRCLLPDATSKICSRNPEEEKEGCHCESASSVYNTVAIRFYPLEEDFYVMATSSGDEELLGARLIGIDGRSMNRVRSRIRELQGGKETFRDLAGSLSLSSPSQLKYLGLSNANNTVTYRLVMRDGQPIERRYNIVPSDGSLSWSWLPAPDRTPWAMQEREKPFRWRDAPELDSVVIQLRQHSDAAQGKVLGFLQSAEKYRVELGRSHVVLDVRDDGGGNFLLTRNFIREWPQHLSVAGKFYVLMSRRTFSAAISSVAYLKQSGGERVILVGEEPGDRLEFFAEGSLFALPNSGLKLWPATARHDYRNGCRTYEDCFIAVAQPGSPVRIKPELMNIERVPIAVKSLAPEIYAPWTIDDWMEGNDSAMDAVAKAISALPRQR